MICVNLLYSYLSSYKKTTWTLRKVSGSYLKVLSR